MRVKRIKYSMLRHIGPGARDTDIAECIVLVGPGESTVKAYQKAQLHCHNALKMRARDG